MNKINQVEMNNNIIVLSDGQLALLKEQLAIGYHSDHNGNSWKSDGMIELIESVDAQTKSKSIDTTKITIELPSGKKSVTRLLHAIEEYFKGDYITLTPDIVTILDNAGVEEDWSNEREELISWFEK